MDLHNLIKKYGEGQGKDTMWNTVSIISDFVEKTRSEHPEAYRELMKRVYASLVGGHFNEDFGLEQIRHMYYKDDNGIKHYAPYWTDEQMAKAYNVAKAAIPSEYTPWDFLVTMNMMASDNHALMEQWFPAATDEELTSKYIDLAINFLDDEDAPHAKTKIWSYFN